MRTFLMLLTTLFMTSCLRKSEVIPFLVPIDSVVIDFEFSFPAIDSIHLRQSEDKPPFVVALRSRRIFDSESLNHLSHSASCYKCAPAVSTPHSIIERRNTECYRHEIMRYSLLTLVSNLSFYTSGFI